MSDKRQVLKITKPNKSVVFGEVAAKRKLEFQNTLKKVEDRLHLEVVEMTDEEIAKHPGFDENYVPVGKGDSSNQLALLKKQLETEGDENKELKKQIEELEKKIVVPPTVSAAQLVAMIEGAESAEEIDELVGDDTRVSIAKAADKKKKSFIKE